MNNPLLNFHTNGVGTGSSRLMGCKYEPIDELSAFIAPLFALRSRPGVDENIPSPGLITIGEIIPCPVHIGLVSNINLQNLMDSLQIQPFQMEEINSRFDSYN